MCLAEYLIQFRAKYLEERLSAKLTQRRTHKRINELTIKQLKENVLEADKEAQYLQLLTLDLSTVRSYVSGTSFLSIPTSNS